MKSELEQRHLTVSSLTRDVEELKMALKEVEEAREQSTIEHTTSYEQQFGVMVLEAEAYRERLK